MEQQSAPDEFNHRGWRFEASKQPMWGTDRLNKFVKTLGMWSSPDMFFGDSFVRFVHSGSSTVVKLCPSDAMCCCSWRCPSPPKALQPPAKSSDQSFFGSVQCRFAKSWKPEVENPDVKELEITTDWTYSTPYWGTFLHHEAPNDSESPGLFIQDFDASAEQPTDEGLPMDLLQRRDDILWYREATFWEHELDDCGLSRLVARVRVMPNFWFALLSFELRVDGVLIRDVCTRLFCHFDKPNEVLREWTWREATYEQLQFREGDFDRAPHISQDSVGTCLLSEADVKQRFRHIIRLGGPGSTDVPT